MSGFPEWCFSLMQTVPAFPAIHSSSRVEVESLANYSLLYTIKGSDASLEPYLLASHLDVVPVEADKWTVPAFEGLVRDGNVFGRGTLDVKDTLMVMTLATLFSPNALVRLVWLNLTRVRECL